MKHFALDFLSQQNLAVCHDCKLLHICPDRTTEARDFFARHYCHNVQLVSARSLLHHLADKLGIDFLAHIFPAFFNIPQLPYSIYKGNASVKESFGTATAFTKTNANLATSATAGWKSNSIDNSSNLYLDMLVSIELAAVNTAPANSKALNLYAYSLIEGTAYASTGDGTIDGSEGTVTFPDFTTLSIVIPIVGIVPYPVQNKAINSQAYSVARCFGGKLPPKNGIAMLNHTGMTLNVTNIYYIETFNTVI
jgi:hypothetical protein